MKVLVICFANTCRSPVVEALLQRAVGDADVTVSSRGLAGGVGTTPEPMVRALEAAGIELSGDTGEMLQREDARSADLLLFLERRLVRDAVVTDPSLWPRSFTVREFARRAMNNPPERTQESFAQWITILHAGRSREELLGADETDDVRDPGLHGDESAFAAMISSLSRDVKRVAPFLTGWPSSAG